MSELNVRSAEPKALYRCFKTRALFTIGFGQSAGLSTERCLYAGDDQLKLIRPLDVQRVAEGHFSACYIKVCPLGLIHQLFCLLFSPKSE